MDNTLLEREQSILDMQAWRGVFKEGVEAGDGEAIVIMEPRDITAVLTPVDAKGLIGSTSRLGPDAFGPELARLGCSGARGGRLSTARRPSCTTRWTESSVSR